MGQCGGEVVVRRNDDITLEEIEKLNPDGILFSPGPCTPNESGVCLDILQWALGQGDQKSVICDQDSADHRPPITDHKTQATSHKPQIPPIFGVCLGCQAMGQAAGGTIARAKNIMHGKASMIRHDGKGLLEGMPNPFRAIRYHSLVVTKDSIPPGFIVTATAEDDGEVMGLRHESLPIEGVQFHPESVLTENGMQIIKNFLRKIEATKLATAL